MALIRLVTGFESSGVRLWSARTCAELTVCVATGGLSTMTANVTVAVLPGSSVTSSAKIGGAAPATVALVPTRTNFTSSKRT